MADSARPKTDLLSRSLQHSLKRQRPWRLPAFVFALAFLTACAALWYWLSARTPPPDPIVVALDSVGVADKPAILTTLFLPPSEASDVKYAQRELLVKLMDAADGLKHRVGDDNRVQVILNAPDKDVPFLVQFRSADRRKFPFEDQATHFAWPADARILIVDVDTTLFNGDDSKLRPGASQALTALHKAGFHIVYLTLEATDPDESIPRRKQLRLYQQDRALPTGPIFLRIHHPNESAGGTREKVLAQLADQFPRPLYVLVGAADLATQCRALPGVAPILLNAKENVPGIPRCTDWSDVRRELAGP